MSRVLIIGAGPAGVSAALYAIRSGMDVTVLYHGSGSLSKAERIENYYGFAEPPTGAELQRNGMEGARKLGVRFIEDEVVWIGMNEGLTGFLVKSAEQEYEADTVILAAGSTRKAPGLLGLMEMEGKGVSYCAVCDAFFYRGKRAAVLGAGEYALHEAEVLLPHAEKVLLFTDGEEPDSGIPDEIEVHREKVEEILGDTRVTGIKTATQTIPADGVFIAYGTAGSTELARKIGAVVTDGHLTVDESMSTSVPGLFAAGDCNGGLLQIAKAVYEGATAGLSAVKYLREKNKSAAGGNS